jgi:hypothetical protein
MAIDISQGIKHKSNTISNFLRAFSQSPKVGRIQASKIHIIRKGRDLKKERIIIEALRLDSVEMVL